MPEYEVVAKAVRNHNTYVSQYEFSKRRKVFVVPFEFLYFELGWDLARFELTPTKAELLESELRLRQLLPADTMIKGMTVEYNPEVVKLYTISPHFDVVPENVVAPEQLIS